MVKQQEYIDLITVLASSYPGYLKFTTKNKIFDHVVKKSLITNGKLSPTCDNGRMLIPVLEFGKYLMGYFCGNTTYWMAMLHRDGYIDLDKEEMVLAKLSFPVGTPYIEGHRVYWPKFSEPECSGEIRKLNLETVFNGKGKKKESFYVLYEDFVVFNDLISPAYISVVSKLEKKRAAKIADEFNDALFQKSIGTSKR